MRELSPKFMTDLKEGILSPILKAVQKDKDLILEIRADCIDIYYRGGRILDVERRGDEYITDFNKDYAKNHPKKTELGMKLPNEITTLVDANRWVDNIGFFKEIMDHHFNNSKNETFEKIIQQLIVQENNLIRSSESTDYFIIDFEYASAKTRFDLVGLFWDRRARSKPNNCKLAIIEVKYGDESLDNDKNGLTAHIVKAEKLLDDKDWVKSFKEEMITIFKQKRELGILNIKNPNEVPIEAIGESVEFMFIIAGHNPGSSILKNELNKMEKEIKKANAVFATSSFTGYALFKENIKSLQEFNKLL